jgi:hypothetical protein
MESIQTKPRLVFFQYKYNKNSTEFSLIHKRDHIKCLAEFFELTVINEDCDYQQICDTHEPAVTLFESGLNLASCRRLKIENVGACPDIPKLGLHNADGWCETRAGIFSDMERWGIETFFSISVTAAEHTPEISDNLYIWPNFIDPGTYRDYGHPKIVPVLLTGATSSLYPWRQKIFRRVFERYPTLVCPHRGYYARARVGEVMCGEQYARAINASWFVPACGTVAKEIVRKHFEVPGCKSCLITEKSPALEAAGFVDMENCVFVEEKDVLAKLEYLFQNAAELERITNAGYQLVHSRHTLKERDQIFQWFTLHQNLKGEERIVQTNPFQPLTVVGTGSGRRNIHVISNGSHLQLNHEGDKRLWAGKYEEAERFYLKCSNYVRWMPEPRIRLVLCKLYRGRARLALDLVVAPIEYTLVRYRASDPDPVEWAYFIVCLLCLGKLSEAIKRAEQFPMLCHPELDRVRWVVNVLRDRGKTAIVLRDDGRRRRYSVHRLPARSLTHWIEHLCIMLRACGQRSWADVLMKYVLREDICCERKEARFDANKGVDRNVGATEKKRFKAPHRCFGRKGNVMFLYRRFIADRVRSKIKRRVLRLAGSLEARFGYFLRYDLSQMKNDEFFEAIARITREADIKTAVVIGAAIGEGSTEAFLAGILENEKKPSVFCINGSTRRFAKLEKRFMNHAGIKFYGISCSCAEQFEEKLAKTLKRIKEENERKSFDAVLIDGSELNNHWTINSEVSVELRGVGFIFLDDINTFCNYKNHNRLLKDPNYALVAQNVELRNGYAIFEGRSANIVGSGDPNAECGVYCGETVGASKQVATAVRWR